MIPKMRFGQKLNLTLNLSVEVDGPAAEALKNDLQQIVDDLNLTEHLVIQVLTD